MANNFTLCTADIWITTFQKDKGDLEFLGNKAFMEYACQQLTYAITTIDEAILKPIV